MAIVSDYMVYGNCKSCGKYLAQGTFCCEGIVQSNYSVWLEGMMNKNKDEIPFTIVSAPGIGVRQLKTFIDKNSKGFFGKVVEDNNRIRETYPLVFAKDKDNPAYYHIILTELFNNNLVTLEQYEAVVESIRVKFSNKEEKGNE